MLAAVVRYTVVMSLIFWWALATHERPFENSSYGKHMNGQVMGNQLSGASSSSSNHQIKP
jgi:hypothetical protein